jgi:hypothetical protein
MSTNHYVDSPPAEASSPLCSRFHREERWKPLHPLPWPEHVPDIHECLYSRRWKHPKEAG